MSRRHTRFLLFRAPLVGIRKSGAYIESSYVCVANDIEYRRRYIIQHIDTAHRIFSPCARAHLAKDFSRTQMYLALSTMCLVESGERGGRRGCREVARRRKGRTRSFRGAYERRRNGGKGKLRTRRCLRMMRVFYAAWTLHAACLSFPVFLFAASRVVLRNKKKGRREENDDTRSS